MSKSVFGPSITVTLGEEGTVVVRRSDSSTPIVARALGARLDDKGQPVRVVLDRRIHRPGEDFHAGEWGVSGAVVSVLERRAVAGSAA